MDINWIAVQCAAFTAIRCTWSVEKLQRMAAEGFETPVSGKALIRAKADLVEARR